MADTPTEAAQAPETPVDPLDALGQAIVARGKGAVLSHRVAHGELTLDVARASIVETVAFLKADASCRFSTLVDVTAVDHPGRTPALRRRLPLPVDVHEPPHPPEGRRRARRTSCPPSSRSTPRPTGSSARSSTCSGSSSRATRTCGACSPTTASAAIRCARTSRPRATPRSATTRCRSAWSTSPCAGAGIPPVRLPVPLGGRRLRAAGRREARPGRPPAAPPKAS